VLYVHNYLRGKEVVAVRSKASGIQTATLEVWSGAEGIIRHQQCRRRPQQSAGEAAGVNRRQRTKTSHLVRSHFNAHICSSANLTRISKVKIPNSNSNINFEVRFNIPNRSFMFFVCFLPKAIRCTSKAYCCSCA